MTARRTTGRSFAAVALALAQAACSVTAMDPVHQAEVDALGPEDPGIRRGPMHRAGQPCTVCHGPEGPAHVTFSLAGTVFQAPDQPGGLDQAEILLVDSLGSSPLPGSIVTNCAGNFYIGPDVWTPAFPVLVAVTSGASGAQMVSHIGRAGSCASCHKDPRGLDSPGRVFVQVGGGAPAVGGCSEAQLSGGGL